MKKKKDSKESHKSCGDVQSPNKYQMYWKEMHWSGFDCKTIIDENLMMIGIFFNSRNIVDRMKDTNITKYENSRNKKDVN